VLLAPPVRRARQDLLAQQARMDLLAPQELPVLLAPQELPAPQGELVQDHKGRPVLQELQAHRALLESRVPLAPQDHKGRPVLQGLMDQRERLGHKGRPV
jgi:hypothetical protein